MAEKNPDEIGALWIKLSERGEYLTGEIHGERVVVFRNEKKGRDKAPDWRVLKAWPKPKADHEPSPDADEPF